jgi:hypothetical protein
MRNRHGIKKNIHRNLPSYDATPVDTAATLSKVIGGICAVIIAVAIPVSLISASFNIVFKIPDIYSFDLDRTLAAKELDYMDGSAPIASLMADYMNHKTDSFTLYMNVNGPKKPLFTENDAQTMRSYRKALDAMFNVMCVCLPISALGYLLTLLVKRKQALKYSIKASVFVYLGSIITAASLMLVGSNVANFSRDVIGTAPSRSDILPQMFGAGFRIEMFAVAGLISTIGMALIYALTAKLTNSYKVFSRSEQ